MLKFGMHWMHTKLQHYMVDLGTWKIQLEGVTKRNYLAYIDLMLV